MKSNNRGFTLIELLVVISIISMLASVVLVSLNSARDKAKDSSAIQSMVSMRNQAEIVLMGNGSYPSNLCESALLTLRQAVQKQVGGADLPTCNRGTGDKSWAVSTTLLSTATFCVDSTGYSGAGTAVNGSCGTGGAGGPSSPVITSVGSMASSYSKSSSFVITGTYTATGPDGPTTFVLVDRYGTAVPSVSGNSSTSGGSGSFGFPTADIPVDSGYSVRVCGGSSCRSSNDFAITN